MKTHLVKEYYKTGDRVTHFKTICGLIRHAANDFLIETDKQKVSCIVCKPPPIL